VCLCALVRDMTEQRPGKLTFFTTASRLHRRHRLRSARPPVSRRFTGPTFATQRRRASIDYLGPPVKLQAISTELLDGRTDDGLVVLLNDVRELTSDLFRICLWV